MPVFAFAFYNWAYKFWSFYYINSSFVALSTFLYWISLLGCRIVFFICEYAWKDYFTLFYFMPVRFSFWGDYYEIYCLCPYSYLGPTCLRFTYSIDPSLSPIFLVLSIFFHILSILFLYSSLLLVWTCLISWEVSLSV